MKRARSVTPSFFTQAETLAELKLNAREAVRCRLGDGEPLPEICLVRPRRIFGSAKGEFTVPDDFNDPLPKDIEDFFYDSKLFPED